LAKLPELTNEREQFARLLTECFPGLSEHQISLLWAHYELLSRWNRVLNLTSIRDLAEVVARHYCESLLLGAQLPPEPVSVLDVGSGGGFPGIPIAVLRPDCSLTLAESHHRKAVFLREATREYPNVRVAARRAEETGEQFDWTVSRAVRWSDVLKVRAAHVGLLLGAEDASQLRRKASIFEWEDPIELPGKRRVLIIGHQAGR
jgi:16S rRNA (guanine527-N7)-methyltransferase